jgi:fructokinase
MKGEQSNLWGIDLGGTKIEGAVLHSSDNPKVLFRDRVSTEAEKGYAHILKQLEKMVGLMADSVGYKPSKIGVGTPGTLDPQLNTMKNCNSTALNGKSLKSDLERILNLEVFIANDANCFTLAEANMGIVSELFPKAQVVFGVILGTGVGGGIVVNGKVINGLQGIAGEWGHNFLHESGGDCYCGKSGCVEKILSGPNLERYYQSVSGSSKKLKEIVRDVSFDPYAKETLDRLIEFLGLGLSAVINVLDPDVIVIGGGVSNVDLIYSNGVKSVKKYVFNNRLDTPILKPKLGDSAGVFGAAFLSAS